VSKQNEIELDKNGWIADIRDLKLAYRSTHRLLTERRRELEAFIERDTGLTMEQLGEKKHRSAYKHWKSSDNGAFAELQQIKEMLSDTNFVIEYLHTGRRPGNMRGIERRSAYQREILVDPMKMQAYVSHSSAGSPTNLSEWERMQIEDALSRLSAQERVCYEMKHGEGYSFKYIADQMGLSPSTVENYVLRAQKKVSEQFNCTLVLECVGG
jgi:RNA polymerase sigma factor (sigma-70 family)